MHPGLHAFLHELIDYAGLFPPARLDLNPAINNFARYCSEADAWMLGRFIIPVGRLVELEAHASLFEEQEPMRFSVLGHQVEGQDVSEALSRTIRDAKAFEEQYDGNVIADRFEFKLEPPLPDRAEIADLFHEAGEHLQSSLSRPSKAFYEVPLMGERWEHNLEMVAELITDHNSSAGNDVIGLKMRCGGVTKDAFPSVDAVARTIHTCIQAEIPMKGTAGLHHPVRHFADSVDTMMHGFLNVFGGAVLAYTHSFDRATLERVVSDEVSDHFEFGEGGFRWMDHVASVEEIQTARRELATSYGSCSFDEPREDLQSLGMLETVSPNT
ncbi:MAG: hypothetical protein R3284_01620 [Rubricoccaceae bacterium]|nr:hypothetical protein [Rubricoccaceae bacterium]